MKGLLVVHDHVSVVDLERAETFERRGNDQWREPDFGDEARTRGSHSSLPCPTFRLRFAFLRHVQLLRI